MSAVPDLTLRNVLSMRTVVIGWPYFWRWLLLLHIPFAFVCMIEDLARHGTTSAAAVTLVVVPLIFIAWAIVALGWIALRVQKALKLPVRSQATLLSMGWSMFWRLMILAALYAIPGIGVSFVAGAIGGFFGGMLSEHGHGAVYGEVAAYVVNSVVQIFALGTVWERTVATRIAKEGNTYIGPTVVVSYPPGAVAEVPTMGPGYTACPRCARAVRHDAARCEYCGAARAP